MSVTCNCLIVRAYVCYEGFNTIDIFAVIDSQNVLLIESVSQVAHRPLVYFGNRHSTEYESNKHIVRS